MKKFILIIMCLVGMALMTGCSNEQTTKHDENPTELHENVITEEYLQEDAIKEIAIEEITIKGI